MDRARKRFADNLAALTALNPDLKVMGDRDWVEKCNNSYICYMAKKIWLYELTSGELEQVNKAVSGYLWRYPPDIVPVEEGYQVVKGQVISVKHACRHEDPCDKHWYMNVRTTLKNTLYTPIPKKIMALWEPASLVGVGIEFWAYVTVSSRDETFGFAHTPRLMNVTKENTNAH